MMARLCLLFGVMALQCSCVSHRIYNDQPRQYLQELPITDGVNVGADLAIIEFDDHGTFWKLDQLEDTIDLIERRNAEAERGVLVVIYAHGWKHNADPDRSEGDLAQFRADLIKIANDQHGIGDQGPDQIIGVYIGWRGDTSSIPVHRDLTFWDRKRTAERMVSINMREALFRVMETTKKRPESKCYIAGHSMGGLIIGKTIAPSITTLLLSNGEQGIRLPADLILLQNPALDGLSSWEFIDFLKRSGAHVKLKALDGTMRDAPGPIIASITSEADTATGALYTAGQAVGALSTKFRHDYPNSMPSQKYLATHAEGHIEYLISHRAWLEDGKVKLERIPNAYNDTPYWVIQTTADIIKDHIDIRNPKLDELLNQISELNELYSTEVQTWMFTNFEQDQGEQ